MINEEEQKMVASKLMGWNWRESLGQPSRKDKKGRFVPFRWSPESERIWWDEIWDALKKTPDKKDDLGFHNIWDLYEEALENLVGTSPWGIHTAKPEICWKALVKALS